MPRTRSLAWAELKIGIVSVAALLLTAAVIFLVSGEGGFSWQRYSVKTVFPDIAGLKPGAPVRLAGIDVGAVTATTFQGDRVEVVMQVRKEHQARITSASVASLGSVSLLGEAAVDITAASGGTPVPEWGYIRSGPGAGSLTDVAAQASTGIEQLTAILQDVRKGRGTVGQLFTNDALYQDLTRLLTAAEEVASRINGGRGTLGRLINDPAAGQALERSLQNLEAVTARIRAGEGSLGRLLTDEAFATSLSSTTANLDAVSGRISRGEGTLGKLVTERELYDRLNATMGRLDALVAALQQGEGTAGQLLRDRQLYDNMNGAVTDLRALITNIRQDPRRYLNVRVSLF